MPKLGVSPGQVIKETILANGPSRASDCHAAYKTRIRELNLDRDRSVFHRGMTFHSFRSFISRALKAGLIEIVDTAPVVTTGNQGLQDIRKKAVVEGYANLYDLTDAGREEEVGWTNLQAYDGS